MENKKKVIIVIILIIVLIILGIIRINQISNNCDKATGHTCSIYEIHNYK